MRQPHMRIIKGGTDERHLQFRAHGDSYGNKVTIRVTESERDGQLIVDLEGVEGNVLIRKEGEDRG